MNKKLLLILPLIALLGACNNQPSKESEPKDSESSSVESISEEESSEESIESSEEKEEGIFATITPDLLPGAEDGNYPAASTFETTEGATFAFDSVMKNTGKYTNDTIQFKSIKKGDAGCIENRTPVKGTLDIVIMENYVEYDHTDKSGELSVFAKSTKDGALKQLEVVSLGVENGKKFYTYETVEDCYYVIQNLSDYAVYATLISWGE